MNATSQPPPKSRVAVAAKWTYAVLALALLFVLMPFLFWRAMWFGRPLTDSQLAAALADTQQPRNIQHGLSQVSERMARGDPDVKRFYPQVLALANSPIPEIRTMDAWVMGGDNTSEDFHRTLSRMISDSDPMVKRNVALALVRFHDASGHAIIAGILKPVALDSPAAGVLQTRAKAGDALGPGTGVARIQTASRKVEVESQITGRFGAWLAGNGANIASGQPIASILPDDDSVWEALRALYLIGTPDDLDAISPFARGGDDWPPRIAQQARLTMEEIRSRAEGASTAPQ